MPDPIPDELIRAYALQVCAEVYGKDEACTEPCDLCWDEATWIVTTHWAGGAHDDTA